MLALHSGRSPDIDHPKWQRGFLGALRPYPGHLIAENWHEVMACVIALADDLADPAALPRDAMADLWAICHLARAWAVEPWGMLRTNALITPEDSAQVNDWITTLSYSVFVLMDGAGLDEVRSVYPDAWLPASSAQDPDPQSPA